MTFSTLPLGFELCSRRALVLGAAVAFGSFCAGCGGGQPKGQPSDKGPGSDSTGSPSTFGGQTGDEFADVIQHLKGETERLPTDGPMSGAASETLAAFAWDFYRQTRTDKNFVYSPYSIAIASAMLYAGAAGDTKQQMADVLHFAGDGDSFHQGWNDLSQFLSDRNIEATETRNAQSLVVTNDFWMAKRLNPKPAFLNVLSSHYGAGVYLADFATDPDRVRRAINAKVAEDTRTLIQDLLPEGAIEQRTLFVLTNALYFKARWELEFDPKATRSAPFGTVDGTEVETEMMNVASAPLGYGTGDGYEAVSLPYFGKELELVAIMPSAGQFDAFVATLDPAKLSAVTASIGPEFLNLRFPKFEIETTLPLKEELQNAGMLDAFEARVADFTPLSPLGPYIAEAFHKTKIVLDEEGTEAAAATAFVDAPAGEPPPSRDVSFDRAFVYFIRDVPTQAVLFVGQFVGVK